MENTKGYIIRQNFDGDSDNYARFDILKPNGDVVAREVYEYKIKGIIDKLPDLTKNEFGYHTKEIKKGTLGHFSKIEEEFEELKDAYEQEDPIMVMCECSDLIGAIKHYAENTFGISLDQLIKFNEKTENAFKQGKR